MTYSDIKLLLEESLILEFANIGSRVHKLGLNITLHLMQPADKHLQHAPRIKIYKKGISETFSISITEPPRVIGNYKDVVTLSEVNYLKQCVQKFKVPFLNFWYDTNMDTNDLEDQMDTIRSGGKVEPTYEVK
jgi:hypothetical protein